jgi:hypothetical protein
MNMTVAKDMKQVAMQIFETVYPQALTVGMVEKLAELAGVDMHSRNCGGYWYVSLCHAGLIDSTCFVGSYLGYTLTPLGKGE